MKKHSAKWPADLVTAIRDWQKGKTRFTLRQLQGYELLALINAGRGDGYNLSYSDFRVNGDENPKQKMADEIVAMVKRIKETDNFEALMKMEQTYLILVHGQAFSELKIVDAETLEKPETEKPVEVNEPPAEKTDEQKINEGLALLYRSVDENKEQTGLKPETKALKFIKKFKGILPVQFERIVSLCAQRIHVLLVGPAGCGKTWLAHRVADALGLPFASISCSVGMSEAMLTGYLVPTGKGGQFVYEASEFVKLYENGGVFLLDEIDAADPNTIVFVNQALANGSFFVQQRVGNPQVKRHKDFVCIAAANTFGTGSTMQYVGRNQLDAATLDRFASGTVEVNYDKNVEAEIVNPRVLAWGLKVRQFIEKHELNYIMSTRVMVELSKMVKAYNWDVPQFYNTYLANWDAEDVKELVKFVGNVGNDNGGAA